MRGSPTLRALMAFVALLALFPLVWRITHPAASARGVNAMTTPQPVKRVTVEGRVNFSAAATSVTVQHLGRDVWSKASPAMAETFSVEIPWPKQGIELHVVVAWPEGTHSAAMRVRLIAPDGNEYE